MAGAVKLLSFRWGGISVSVANVPGGVHAFQIC
jgi:hypothetical protein